MRIQNSLKNIYIGILSQIIITLLGFLSRRIFIDSLGTEYLGVNGLLTNILSMLSLVEAGIGTSIVYNLYKPLADNDREKILALVQLYKKLYIGLSLIILMLSSLLYPFLGHLVGTDTEIKYLGVVYFIFVFRNIVSYLNAHKWSLINADQKGFILSKVNLIFDIISTIVKIAMILITNSYVLYLVVDLIIFIVQNLYNGYVVNKLYPYIKEKRKYNIEIDIKNNLITNVKALFWHNVGRYIVFGTDNILISIFVNIYTVGLYSNYTMIMNQLSAIVNTILSGINASIGNLVATESKDKNYEIFKVVYFVNFWIYSFSCIFLYNLLEPFIKWWIGEGYLLGRGTFIVILVNFYIAGLRTSIGTFKEKAGIFKEDQYIPIFESIVNLVASILLANKLGLVGVFLGTTISTVALPLWNQPRLVYKKLFKKPLIEYFKSYIIYILLTILLGYLTSEVCNIFVSGFSFSSLVIRGVICTILPNIMLVLVFYRTNEFKYLLKSIINVVNKKYKILSV